MAAQPGLGDGLPGSCNVDDECAASEICCDFFNLGMGICMDPSLCEDDLDDLFGDDTGGGTGGGFGATAAGCCCCCWGGAAAE